MPEPDQPTARPTAITLFKHALIYGGAAGVLAVAWSLIEMHLALNTAGGVKLWLLTLARLAFPIGGITLGIVYWRDRVVGGNMRFAQAFGAGLAIGLIFAAIQGLFFTAFASSNPDYVARMVESYKQYLISAGRSEEEVAQELESISDWATPAGIGLARLAEGLKQSLVISLMAGLFVRKRVSLLSTRQGD